jgi:hypothetical protein
MRWNVVQDCDARALIAQGPHEPAENRLAELCKV